MNTPTLFSLDTGHSCYLEGMVRLYNAQTAVVLHIAPFTPDRFVDRAEKKSYFDPSGLFVAQLDGEVTGWIHACQAPGTEPWSPPGIASHNGRALGLGRHAAMERPRPENLHEARFFTLCHLGWQRILPAKGLTHVLSPVS